MSQIIDLRDGAIEYTWPLTLSETNLKDISAATVQLALTPVGAPAGTVLTWLTPDRDPAQTVKSQRIVQLLVGGALKPAAGTYWLYSRVLDSPEVIIRRQQRVTILA